MSPSSEHFQTASDLWRKAQSLKNGSNVTITGKELDIATVFAVSQGGRQPFLTEDKATCARIHESVKQLNLLIRSNYRIRGKCGFQDERGAQAADFSPPTHAKWSHPCIRPSCE